jgi:hypothetical protein
MTRYLSLLFLVGCAAPTSYMSSAIEVHCPLPVSKEECQGAIERMCRGSSYIVMMSVRHSSEQVVYVSCERAQ